MTLPFAIGVVVKLGVGMHAFAFAAPVPLSLIDEPVVDLFQIQGTNSLQVLLLCLLNTKIEVQHDFWLNIFKTCSSIIAIALVSKSDWSVKGCECAY